MKNKMLLLLSAALCCFLSLGVSGQKAKSAHQWPAASLKIGDPAPPLVAAKWIKGTPVSSFAPGHVYVIEFWATWCGPCRASMPHLSEVARKFREKATVLSFDVQELIAGKDKQGDYVSKVTRFVHRLGDGMDYTVAADVREGTMWNTWMKAAGLGGIPAAFIVDQQGRIAWIGHPIQVEEPLSMIIAGSYDQAGKEKLAQEMKARNEKVMALREQLKVADSVGHYQEAISLIDEIIPLSPFATSAMVSQKYELLTKTDPDAARNYANQALKAYVNDPLTLQRLAMGIVENKEDASPDYEMGLKIMKVVASKCDSEDPYAVGDLAEAYFKAGQIQKAVETQQRVVAILNDTSLVEQKQFVKDKAQENLKKYQAGLGS